jgi:hypothetical protein
MNKEKNNSYSIISIWQLYILKYVFLIELAISLDLVAIFILRWKDTKIHETDGVQIAITSLYYLK